MVSFGTDILVYATSRLPEAKAAQARNVMARAMRAGSGILLLQTLAEFSDMARKALVRIEDIENMVRAWCDVLPVLAADEDDFWAGFKVLPAFPRFWDALLLASVKRAGVKHLLTEKLTDGFNFQGVVFVNPFLQKNDRLIDRILRPSRRRR